MGKSCIPLLLLTNSRRCKVILAIRLIWLWYPESPSYLSVLSSLVHWALLYCCCFLSGLSPCPCFMLNLTILSSNLLLFVSNAKSKFWWGCLPISPYCITVLVRTVPFCSSKQEYRFRVQPISLKLELVNFNIFCYAWMTFFITETKYTGWAFVFVGKIWPF